MNVLFASNGKVSSELDSMYFMLEGTIPEQESRFISIHGGNTDKIKKERLTRELKRAHVMIWVLMDHDLQAALTVANLAKQQGCITVMLNPRELQPAENLAIEDGVDVVLQGWNLQSFRDVMSYIAMNPRGILLRDIPGIAYCDEIGELITISPDNELTWEQICVPCFQNVSKE